MVLYHIASDLYCVSGVLTQHGNLQMQAQSRVELSVLGSWSLPKEGQEGMESFLRDLSTIFPEGRWLQISREMGNTGFTCDIIDRNQSKTRCDRVIHW